MQLSATFQFTRLVDTSRYQRLTYSLSVSEWGLCPIFCFSQLLSNHISHLVFTSDQSERSSSFEQSTLWRWRVYLMTRFKMRVEVSIRSTIRFNRQHRFRQFWSRNCSFEWTCLSWSHCQAHPSKLLAIKHNYSLLDACMTRPHDQFHQAIKCLISALFWGNQ